MATHDYVISNASGASVRADLNNALAAIVSNNSNATSPATTYAYQWWADTTTGQLKLRNSANSAWITIFELDGTMLMEDGSLAAPGLAFASDLDTGFSRSASNKINFSTGGAERLEIGDSEVVFNDPSNDVDFRVESNGNANMLFVDAGSDRVGIGTSSIDRHFHVEGTDNVLGKFQNNGSLCLIEFEDTNTTAGNRPSFGSVGNEAVIHAAGSEAIRLDSSGRLLAGTTTATNNLRLEQSLAIVNEGAGTNGGAGFTNYGGTNADAASIVDINRSRGTTDGTMTAVASGDTLGFIQFRGADGTNFIRSAQIVCEVDGTPDTNDMPGRLILGTTADGASSPTERFRIDSSGNVGIKSTNPLAQLHILNSSGTNGFYLSRANGTTIGDQPSVNIIADSAKTRIYGYGDALTFWTAATSGTASEAMRISSSGQVAIGSSSPGHELVVAGSQPFLELRSTDTGNHAAEDVFSGILFGTDDTSTSVDPHGFIKAVHTRAGSGHSSADAGLTFGTSASTTAPATERMRLDTSGRLGIGTTSPDRTLSVSETSGGLLARFLGPTNNLFIDNDRSGIIDIFSTGTGDSLAFGTEDTERMRILSGGGLTFNGDTAQANALDDYEEGTFTPAFQSGTFTYGNVDGRYVKIGQQVTAHYLVSWSSKSGTGTLQVNLPFATGGNAHSRFCGALGYLEGIDNGGNKQLTSTVSGNGSTAVSVFIINDNAAPSNTLVQNLSSSGEFQMSISYIV